jgi:dipeptidyl aminopeptidase/acylaminoacyl peptidase
MRATTAVLTGLALLLSTPAAIGSRPKPVALKPFQIYVTRPDGSHVRAVGKLGRLHPQDVRWSPDGGFLAFDAVHNDPDFGPINDVYVMSGKTGKYFNATEPFDPGGNVVSWAWSPDSQNVAGIVDTYPTSGGETTIPGIVFGLSLVFLSDPSTWDPAVAFAWSPDGRSAAYTDGAKLQVVASDWSSRRLVTTVPAPYTWLTDPSWAPDGTRIAFGAAPDKQSHGHVFVVNADGTGLVDVTGAAGTGYAPVWSPAGSRIAFDAPDGAFIVNSDGSAPVAVNVPGRNFLLRWSPDGKRLVLADAPGGHVYVVNADGSGRVDVTGSAGRDLSPVWSPDGKHIALMRRPRHGASQIVIVLPNGKGVRIAGRLPTRTATGSVDWSSKNELVFSAGRS